MSGDEAQVVADGYDAVADAYETLERDDATWPRGRRLAALIERLPAGAAVVDLGCGNGVPVARDLARRGFAVTGVDVSPKQVRQARERVPEATFAVGGMLEAELPEGAFEAVVSLYAIDHVPRERHGEVFVRIRELLRPGGLALVAIEDGDQPGVVADWLGAPMFFSVWPAAEERRLAEAAGLDVLSCEVETQDEQGRDIPYTWLLLGRSSAA